MKKGMRILLAAALVCILAGAASAQETVPANAMIAVALNQGVSSKDAKLGDRVDGSVSEDVVVNGKVVIPRGSRVTMSVADVVSASRIKGKSKLWLKIDSIDVRGRKYTPSAYQAGQSGAARGKRTAVGAGGGAAAGALIGAIAGGGKGAAIGAAVGAGAGTAGAAMTGEVEVEFKPEKVLRFKLKSGLTVQ
jgi:hypothetical protein